MSIEAPAFSLRKRIKCFPFTLRWRNLKMQQSPVIFDLCLRKTWAGKSHDYQRRRRFRKARSVFKMLSVDTKTADVFKFLQFEERFPKVPFSWRINVDGRPSKHGILEFGTGTGTGIPRIPRILGIPGIPFPIPNSRIPAFPTYQKSSFVFKFLRRSVGGAWNEMPKHSHGHDFLCSKLMSCYC